MPEITISSTGWLAICLRNGTVGVFNLNDVRSWQCLKLESIDDHSNENNVNRNVIKFSPNGQILIMNGQRKQLNVYIQTDFEKSEVWWQLKQTILVPKHISTLDLTNEFLLIVDKSGDIHKVDLLFNDNNKHLILSKESCLIKHSSMFLDILFICNNDKQSFILTTNHDDNICLNYYPNISHSQNSCIGHREFISHLKLIDNEHILSASGDGTLRLWHFPNCVPLVFLHSKVFTLLSKQIFYTQLYNSTNLSAMETYRTDAMPYESSLDSSSTIDYSIWNMDVASYESNVYIAFSIYAHRFHSIYLTSLLNMKNLTNQQRKLTLDSSYGTIVDYCFPSKEIVVDDYLTDSTYFLYILFDSNILLRVNIISVLCCNASELFVQSNETIQHINNLLASKDFYSIACLMHDKTFDDVIYKQSFKNCIDSTDSSYSKRKMERIEQQQRKKQASVQSHEDNSVNDYT